MTRKRKPEKKEEIELTPEQQKHREEIYGEAQKLIDTGEAYKYLLDNIKRRYVGGEANIKFHLAARGAQMCGNTSGVLIPNMTGDYGTGKTSLQLLIAHHLSENYKRDGARTKKAIYYGNYPPGCVTLFDNVDSTDDILNQIINMRTAYFQTKMRYEIPDVVNGTVKEMFLNERVQFWFNGRNAAFEDACLSRQLILQTDEGREQRKKVTEFKSEGYQTGTTMFEISSEVEICRAIDDILMKRAESDPVKVKLTKIRMWNIDDPRAMDQVADAIRGIAAYHRNDREKDGNGYIIADDFDYEEVLSMFKNRSTDTHLSKLTRSELIVLGVLKSNPTGITQAEICDVLGMAKSVVHDALEGRNGHGGLVEKLPGYITIDDASVHGYDDIDGANCKMWKRKRIYRLNVDPEKIPINKNGQISITATGNSQIFTYFKNGDDILQQSKEETQEEKIPQPEEAIV